MMKEEQLEKVMFIPGVIVSYFLFVQISMAIPFNFYQAPGYDLLQLLTFFIFALIFSVIFAKWSASWLIDNLPLMRFSFFLILLISLRWIFSLIESLVYTYSLPMMFVYPILSFALTITLSIYLSKVFSHYFYMPNNGAMS
ncbi:hypothetical protein LGQ02_03335 [Bacillus shivajii]|uniref:hypothetical protein n=1 Tax=Bacillus shivajii TaxID=1983719 RepID=UPI001CFB187D|nr:hypothetical protein [Bacillus shivajii]UCZ53832.1 hypothetical protein LGQ02_03335 [Bacillus shivajii]